MGKFSEELGLEIEEDGVSSVPAEDVEVVEDTPAEEPEGPANNLVVEAISYVESVDAALTRVIDKGNIKELGGTVNPKNAALAYVATVILHEGLSEASRFLHIPVDQLEKIAALADFLRNAAEFVSDIALETPAILPIAAIFWGIRTLGRSEMSRILEGRYDESPEAVEKRKQDDAEKSKKRTMQRKDWGKVGIAIQYHLRRWPAVARFVSNSMAQRIGMMVATRGGLFAMAIAAFIYRSELYGAGKAIYDLTKPDPAQVEADLEVDIYDQGAVDNPEALWINESTGEVRKGKNPGPPFVPMGEGHNSGGLIAPNKRGTFKAQATKMGMSTKEAANTILAAPEGKYSPAMRKKANFAKNFAHEDGGLIATARAKANHFNRLIGR